MKKLISFLMIAFTVGLMAKANDTNTNNIPVSAEDMLKVEKSGTIELNPKWAENLEEIGFKTVADTTQTVEYFGDSITLNTRKLERDGTTATVLVQVAGPASIQPHFGIVFATQSQAEDFVDEAMKLGYKPYETPVKGGEFYEAGGNSPLMGLYERQVTFLYM